MNIKLLFLTIVLTILSSCKNEPRVPYAYEQTPEYTYMELGFYEQCYDNIPNYAFSFIFLSDGLLSENGTEIVAPGQYLHIEDFFVPKERLNEFPYLNTDNTLTEFLDIIKGEYKASGKIGAENYGDSLTFAPGEYFKIDSTTYILGARITYYEENDSYSTRKLITEGSFTITADSVVFDLKTEDGQALGGRYKTPPEQEERKVKVKYSSKREFEQLK